MAVKFKDYHNRIYPDKERVAFDRDTLETCFVPIIEYEFSTSDFKHLDSQVRGRDCEQSIREILRPALQTNSAKRLRSTDRHLAQAILLHRLQQEYFQGNRDCRHRKSANVALMGTMMQHHLTRALLELDDDARKEVLEWSHHFMTFHVQNWYSSYQGAVSVVRTILASSMLDDAQIYLPNTAEDLTRGIDLFVISGIYYLALSIKTSPVHDVFIPCVTEVPQGYPRKYKGELKHIKLSAEYISKQYRRTFCGLLILVGKPHVLYEIPSWDEDTIDLYCTVKEHSSSLAI